MNGALVDTEVDERSEAWDGWKYVFRGPSEDMIEMYLVVKILGDEEPERLFVITAHGQE